MFEEAIVCSSGVTGSISDLNPLAIFSARARVLPSAQTDAMTVYRDSDGATKTIGYLAGAAKPKDAYNLFQGADGKQGLLGIDGVGALVSLDEGIFTVTRDGYNNYANVQLHPTIFNSTGRRVFFRHRVRGVAGNVPKHVYFHIDTLTTGRTTYEIDFSPDNPFEWQETYCVIDLGTSHYLSGDQVGAAADNRIIERMMIAVEFDSAEDAQGAVWQIDGRVSETEQYAAVMLDLGTSSVNPLYDMTAEEINAAYPSYVKAFGYDTGEVDAASIVEFCAGTIGRVQSVKDLTGNDYTISQGTSESMPIICKNNTMYPGMACYGIENYFTANGAILNGQSEFAVTVKYLAGLGGDFASDSVDRYIFAQGTQASLKVNAAASETTFKVGSDSVVSDTHLFDSIATVQQKNDSVIKTYINKALANSEDASVYTITDTSNTLIGTNGTGFFYGLISEICFYGSNISPRIAALLSKNSTAPDSAEVSSVGKVMDNVNNIILAYGMSKLGDHPYCMEVERQSDKATMLAGFVGKSPALESVSNFTGYSSAEVTRVINQTGNGIDLYPNENVTVNIPPTSVITSADVSMNPDTVNDIFVTEELVDGYGISAADSFSVQFKGVINENETYSYQFWAKFSEEMAITVTVNGANSKTFNASPGKWKHCKLEGFEVDNYTAGTNDYLEISCTKGGFLQVYGLKVCKNNRISNRPLIVDNGTLKASIITNLGQYLTTERTNCRGRYIRDYLKRGSTVSTTSHWVQVAATKGPVNVALNKSVTCNFEIANGVLSCVTSGDILSGAFVGAMPESVDPYVQVDLGSVMDLDNVVTWHVRTMDRTYHGNVTQVSEDGHEWITIYDSDVDGERKETEVGNIIFDRALHCLNSFSVYVGFSPDNINSDIYARICGKGGADMPTVTTVKNGWALNRGGTTDEGHWRTDSNTNSNLLGVTQSVWDERHSLFYIISRLASNVQMKVYKDWKRVTNVTGQEGASASNGVVTYPIGAGTINNPWPLNIGGVTRSFVGGISTFILFGDEVSEEEMAKLRDCAM